MTPKDAAFSALQDATDLDMTVGEVRFGVIVTLGLHGHAEPEDVFDFASDGELSDRDMRPGDESLSMLEWADVLEARA